MKAQQPEISQKLEGIQMVRYVVGIQLKIMDIQKAQHVQYRICIVHCGDYCNVFILFAEKFFRKVETHQLMN